MTARARQKQPYTDDKPVFIGIGANLPHRQHGSPDATCRAAVRALDATEGLSVEDVSRWYESAPQPATESQPWYVNGVVQVRTDLPPAELLTILHRIEADFGRQRSAKNAARVLDLDLLDYRGIVSDGAGSNPVLPHPRLSGRAFVLLPLFGLAPDWRHPVSGHAITDLIAGLPTGQEIRLLAGRG